MCVGSFSPSEDIGVRSEVAARPLDRTRVVRISIGEFIE